MSAGKLVLVRHAMPEIDAGQPSHRWRLSDEGRGASRVLALFLQGDCGSKIYSSQETKAKQTADEIARLLGLGVVSDSRFNEVTRPWIGGESSYEDLALEYLQGLGASNWEPRQDATRRFSSAIDEIRTKHDGGQMIVVTHGLVMTSYLAAFSEMEPGIVTIDPIQFWSSLEFPDAWALDVRRKGALTRVGFTFDGLPISPEPPHGAAVLVYRTVGDRVEFLLLHRAGNPQKGDWAWTPPSGARFPGEEVMACAVRELQEEVGLDLTPEATDLGSEFWAQFLLKVSDFDVKLSSEHDSYEWVEAGEACDRCLPATVSNAMKRALEHINSDLCLKRFAGLTAPQQASSHPDTWPPSRY